MNEISLVKWWNEICGRWKWEKRSEESTQTPFRPSQNPHEWPRRELRNPAVDSIYNIVNIRFQGASTYQVIGAHNEWLLMIMMANCIYPGMDEA